MKNIHSQVPSYEMMEPYVEAKFRLTLLKGKEPIKKGWPQTTRAADDVLAEAKQRECNVGVVLDSKHLIIDVDPRNYEKGQDSLDKLCKDLGLTRQELFNCPYVETGGGGFHLYFSKPVDLEIVSKLNDYPGIDFKTAGGQVVAAGSIHPDTTKYYKSDFTKKLSDISEAPKAILDILSSNLKTGQVLVSPSQSKTLKTILASIDPGEITPLQLEGALDYLPVVNYQSNDSWFNLMASCHYLTNGHGIDVFTQWSISDPAYRNDANKIKKRWNSLGKDHPNKIKGGFLYNEVKQYNGHIPHSRAEDDFDVVWHPSEPLNQAADLERTKSGQLKNHFPNCLKLISHLNPYILGLTFNEFDRDIYLIKPNLPSVEQKPCVLTEDIVRYIREVLVDHTGVDWSKDSVYEAIYTIALRNKQHPVKRYLTNLMWDKKPRLDTLLINYAGAKDDEYTRQIAAKVMIAAVKRIKQPGCKFDNVLVLEGKQGYGKSSFVKELLPHEDWFSDAPLNSLENKDTILSLQGRWLLELGEMSVLSKADNEALKSFISRTADIIRRPYERRAEKIPRQFILIGTTNQSTYLKDPTGNRRFWPIAVKEIDLEALKKDRDQLWAEAVVREGSGESLTLPPELWQLANQVQLSRLEEDPWCDAIQEQLDHFDADIYTDFSEQYIAKQNNNTPIKKIHSTFLLTHILRISPDKQNPFMLKRLKNVMDSIGWEYKDNVRVDGKQGKGYQRRDS